MKIKTEQEIVEIAKKCIPKVDGTYNYIEGYSQAQSDLLESASDGFVEWEHDWRVRKDKGTPSQLEVWQACSLHHAKLTKEKDERSKELESKHQEDVEDIEWLMVYL